jgi:hypothetical protein
MKWLIALCVLLMQIVVSGCSESESVTSSASKPPAASELPVTPEQSGPFETRVTYRPFVLTEGSAGWATPFGVQVSESRYDLALSEFAEQSPDGTPENVAARAMQLMLDGDSDGLIELASDDSRNVKLYAGLGKKFVDEPVALQRLNIADHSCIIFGAGNVQVQGAVIPLRRIGDTYQFFLSSQINSLQQFLFQVTNGLIRYLSVSVSKANAGSPAGCGHSRARRASDHDVSAATVRRSD